MRPAGPGGGCSVLSGSTAPEKSRRVTLTADPRLLARFDAPAPRSWRIAAGRHGVTVARAANDAVLTAEVTMAARRFGP